MVSARHDDPRENGSADGEVRTPLGGARLRIGAVEEKASEPFIGFAGLLYHDDWPEGEHMTEVGWRLDCSYWAGVSRPRAR